MLREILSGLSAMAAMVVLVGCGGDESASSPQPTGGSGGALSTGGSGGSGGSGGVSTGGSGGGPITPTTVCYAPCMWNLVSGCRPVSTCIVEANGNDVTECDPDSSWRLTSTPTDGMTVTDQQGNLCYTTVPIVSGSEYHDAAGDLVVTIDYSQTSGGAYFSYCADSPTTPVLTDHNAPECEAQAFPTCTEGVCPAP